MNANYPKKCWYVAATSDEVADEPVGRRLLGEDIVLWRGHSGTVAAFENRCAHRAFPLSHSRIDGDRLVCGYHGCTYRADGSCERIPSQREVPTGMRVPVFPVLEEPPFVWIWLGPSSAASLNRPPRTPWVNDPAWSTFSESWRVGANYMMIHEHYLDFSYAPVVHAGDLPPGIAEMPSFDDVEVTETTVSYTRTLPPAPLADWEAKATGLDRHESYARRERGIFASPAMHIQRWDIENGSAHNYSTVRTHAITPETTDSTHIFMQASRNYATDRDDVTTSLRAFADGVAGRDTAILEMASTHAGYDGWQSGVEFQADAAVLRIRRIVATLLAMEAGRSSMRPGLPTVSPT